MKIKLIIDKSQPNFKISGKTISVNNEDASIVIYPFDYLIGYIEEIWYLYEKSNKDCVVLYVNI